MSSFPLSRRNILAAALAALALVALDASAALANTPVYPTGYTMQTGVFGSSGVIGQDYTTCTTGGAGCTGDFAFANSGTTGYSGDFSVHVTTNNTCHSLYGFDMNNTFHNITTNNNWYGSSWGPLQFVRISICTGAGDGFSALYLDYFDPTATPTPTITPTGSPVPSATAFMQAQACISANVVSTPTPMPQRSPTPFGTRTPASGTPAPTATPLPQQFISRSAFQNGLDQWTTNGLAAWSDTQGPDQSAGLAVLPFTAGSTITGTGSTQLTAPNDALILERQDMPGPWRIAGDVRISDGIPASTHAYLQVFAWVDGGLGTGAWQLIANQPVSQAWGTWTAYSALTETRAIALRAVLGLSSMSNPLGFIPQDYPARSVWIDNLRVVAGREYNSPMSIGLPVCSGSGASTQAATTTRLCTINRKTVDVMARCQAPTDLLNIGGWIGWLFCQSSTFFGFIDENRQQITAIQIRQRATLPFGLFYDVLPSFAEIIGTIDSVIASMGTVNGDTPWWVQASSWFTQSGAPVYNWDQPPSLTPVQAEDCTANIPNLNGNTLRAACTVIRTARDNAPVLKIGEWMFHFSMFMLLWTYVQRKWLAQNG